MNDDLHSFDSDPERELAVFTAARARPAEERDTWIENECGDDTALADRVRQLLAGLETMGGFLAKPIAEQTLDQVLDRDALEGPLGGGRTKDGRPQRRFLKPGTRIDDFTLGDPIDVGGMGIVYEAHQEKPRRRVAVKMLQWTLLTPSARSRFEREPEILARLQHPAIATVLSAGTYRDETPGPGQDWVMPWFAMEFVDEARSITEYAEQEGLDTNARIELVARFCDGIALGHEQGIVHRDLKPANLLVDSRGNAKVIDFGVARLTDSDLARTHEATAEGELVGTILYMSPEQCAGKPDDIGPPSDVYGLGVALYELLCGTHPHPVEDIPKILAREWQLMSSLQRGRVRCEGRGGDDDDMGG